MPAAFSTATSPGTYLFGCRPSSTIDKVLALEPKPGLVGPRFAFLTIGSSTLKIGLHPEARIPRGCGARSIRCRYILGRISSTGHIMNFYNTDPMVEMVRGPVARLVEIGRMLEHTLYRKIRPGFFRLHCRFISGNRAAYDHFMLVCGPLAAQRRTSLPDGAQALIGQDGGLLAPPQRRLCP